MHEFSRERELAKIARYSFVLNTGACIMALGITGYATGILIRSLVAELHTLGWTVQQILRSCLMSGASRSCAD